MASDGRLFFTTGRGGIEKGDGSTRCLGAMLYCDRCAEALFTKKVWEEATALRTEMNPEEVHSQEGRAARSEVIDFSIALRAKRQGRDAERSRDEARQLGELWWKDQNEAGRRLDAQAEQPGSVWLQEGHDSAPASGWTSDILKGLRIGTGGTLVFIGIIGGITQISKGPGTWATALLITGSGIGIWISEKAKPLAGRPYRWGTYVGIMSGVAAAAICLFALIFSVVLGGFGFVLAILVVTPFTVASVGILRRKRFGVIVFLAMWAITVLAMCAGPVLTLFGGKVSGEVAVRAGALGALALGLLVVPNCIYFAKRWKLMS